MITAIFSVVMIKGYVFVKSKRFLYEVGTEILNVISYTFLLRRLYHGSGG
jgi:hypothetical protein